jgi:hypothetical protein
MKHVSLASLLFGAILLSGCVTTTKSLQQQSSFEICKDFMMSSRLNVNRNIRRAELKRRGEDCSKFAGAIAGLMQAKAAGDMAAMQAWQGLQQMQRTNTFQQPLVVPMPAPSIHNYSLGNKHITCTKMGNSTYCN